MRIKRGVNAHKKRVKIFIGLTELSAVIPSIAVFGEMHPVISIKIAPIKEITQYIPNLCPPISTYGLVKTDIIIKITTTEVIATVKVINFFLCFSCY